MSAGRRTLSQCNGPASARSGHALLDQDFRDGQFSQSRNAHVNGSAVLSVLRRRQRAVSEPRPDRPPIPFGHLKTFYPSEGERPGLLVFVADPYLGITVDMAAVRDDQNINTVADVVLPTIQDRPDSHRPVGLLGDLPADTVGWVLAELKFAAWQFPFVPLVVQQ